MMDEKEKDIINEIKKGLDFIDEASIGQPGLEQFKQLVSQVETKKRTKKNLEFVLFIFTATIILSFSVGIYQSRSSIFLMVQASALLIIPGVMYLWSKKHKEVNNQ